MRLDTQINDHYSYKLTPSQQKASLRLQCSTYAGPSGPTAESRTTLHLRAGSWLSPFRYNV